MMEIRRGGRQSFRWCKQTLFWSVLCHLVVTSEAFPMMQPMEKWRRDKRNMSGHVLGEAAVIKVEYIPAVLHEERSCRPLYSSENAT